MQHESRIDRLFRKAEDSFEEIQRNPVTGSTWLSGADPVAPQKRVASRALAAREWFRMTAPKDAPPLPLSYEERERIKLCGLQYIVSVFARSLAVRDYHFDRHPSFEDYARAVLASPYTPPFIKLDQQLRQLFPPRELHGLGPGLIWR